LRLAVKKKNPIRLNEPTTSPRPPRTTGALPTTFVWKSPPYRYSRLHPQLNV